MAIQFKAAPAAPDSNQGVGFDIVGLLEATGKLNLAMLIVLVVIIYGIVLYLRSTPGYRLTDISLKCRPKGEAAVTRVRAPPPPPEEPAGQG
jgi:hypothetical protein